MRRNWLLVSLVAICLLFTKTTHAEEFELLEATIADVHRAFESGQLTCRDLTSHYIQRIEAYDATGPSLNSIQLVNPNALQDAASLDQQIGRSGLVGP